MATPAPMAMNWPQQSQQQPQLQQQQQSQHQYQQAVVPRGSAGVIGPSNGFGTRCHFCKDVIAGDQFIRADLMACHIECFCCCICCSVMLGLRAFRLGNRICCQRCFRVLTVCAHCGGPIINGKSWVELHGKAYHPHHLFCSAPACGTVLKFEPGFTLGERRQPLCLEHHLQAVACAVCGIQIVGEAVQLTDRCQTTLRHPECFMCSLCGCLLSWEFVVDQFGRPMCSEHVDMSRAFERIVTRMQLAAQRANQPADGAKEEEQRPKKERKRKGKKKRKKRKGRKKKRRGKENRRRSRRRRRKRRRRRRKRKHRGGHNAQLQNSADESSWVTWSSDSAEWTTRTRSSDRAEWTTRTRSSDRAEWTTRTSGSGGQALIADSEFQAAATADRSRLAQNLLSQLPDKDVSEGSSWVTTAQAEATRLFGLD